MYVAITVSSLCPVWFGGKAMIVDLRYVMPVRVHECMYMFCLLDWLGLDWVGDQRTEKTYKWRLGVTDKLLEFFEG